MKKAIIIILTLLLWTLNIGFSLAEEICGIGVAFTRTGHEYSYPTITQVVNNSPALKAGIQNDDRIIEVDGKDVVKLSQLEIANLIKGAKGSKVKLLIQRDGQNKVYVLSRDNFKFPASYYAPKWAEFCPSQFVDAEYHEISAYKPSNKANMWALTIIGMPYLWHEQAQHQSKMLYLSASNYWVQRRKVFESEIQTCLGDEQNATACFMQVRQLENSKNDALRQEELAQQQMNLQARMNAQNSIQSSIQSQQLNNSINNLNYGLNNINTNLMMMQMNRR